MYAKILNPATNGKVVYNNQGSARRCTNYLVQEAKEAGRTAAFFGAEAQGVQSADEAVAMLDNNHKGLAQDAPKFHSLVLSPSADELARLGNSAPALEQYTREVMELYAQNFQLKDGRKLGAADVVWAATIHQERHNRGTDEGAQKELKPGLQTHVHVMVSARDAAQKITLNPLGKADRFNRVQFQAQASTQLEARVGRSVPRAFGEPAPTRPERVAQKAAEITDRAAAVRGEKKPLTPAQLAAKEARLDAQVERVNTKLGEGQQLDAGRVQQAAQARGYDRVFYTTLGRIERNAEAGKYTRRPYDYLATGRVSQRATLQLEMGGPPRREQPERPVQAAREAKPSAGMRVLEQTMNDLARALSMATRIQDMRSKAEKDSEKDSEQEYEPAW